MNFISDNMAVIDLDDIKGVNKLNEKRFYNTDPEDFEMQYYLTITYSGRTESLLIHYNDDNNSRDLMFDRLEKILVKK